MHHPIRPKIALCFLSRTELYNKEIWYKYFDKDIFNIYIHPNIGYQLKTFSEFQITNLRHKGRGYKMLAIISLLETAMKNNNYKYVLLSDDCYPITCPSSFYEYCISHDLSNIRYLDSWVSKGHPRYISELTPEQQKANADWWILNQAHARLIIDSKKTIEQVYTKYSDDSEHAISCILNEHNYLNDQYVLNLDVLYENYDFINQQGNYAKFCYEQFEEIKNFLITKHYFFLRKFYDSSIQYKEYIKYQYRKEIYAR